MAKGSERHIVKGKQQCTSISVERCFGSKWFRINRWLQGTVWQITPWTWPHAVYSDFNITPCSVKRVIHTATFASSNTSGAINKAFIFFEHSTTLLQEEWIKRIFTWLCYLSNVGIAACMFLGPSRKREPRKDSIEARLHQTEVLVGIMLTLRDPYTQSLLRDITRDSAFF